MINNNKSKKLYLNCIEDGIEKLDSKANIARMVLKAKNMGISGTEEELIEIYNSGKAIVQGIQEKNVKEKEEDNRVKAIERLKNIRNEEQKEIAYILKIASLTGTEKPIHFLKEEISILRDLQGDYRKEREDFFKFQVAMYEAGKVEEKDWAILGGIASGIAGGAAGVATALEAQQHNAYAREHNKEWGRSVAEMLQPVTPSAKRETDIDEEVQELREEIAECKEKLIEYLPQMDLLLRLRPELQEQYVTETGAIRLSVKTKAASNVVIYDEVRAVVDGSFKALLMDNEEVVGEAIFVLPADGALRDNKLFSICIDVPDGANKKYDVVFVPNKLWAIETDGVVKNKENDVKSYDKYKTSVIYYASDILKRDDIECKEYEYVISILDNKRNNEKEKKLLKDLKEKFEIVKEKNQQKNKRKEKAVIRGKKLKKLAIILSPVVVLAVIAVVFFNTVIMPGIRYDEAVRLMETAQDKEALAVFAQLKNYKNSKVFAKKILEKRVSAGRDGVFIANFDGTVDVIGKNVGEQYNATKWTDIVSVRSMSHTVGLKSDKTVVAVGSNEHGECDVENWNNIVSICVGDGYTVGLKSDGTVVAVGDNEFGQCDVSKWSDVISICTGNKSTAGLKSDGTVVTTGVCNRWSFGIEEWTDIVDISIGGYTVIGLKSDGTVVTGGDTAMGNADVSSWNDIVAVHSDDFYTAGVKSDGTVMLSGFDVAKKNQVSEWKDIVYVQNGTFGTVGLKSDGTVMATGYGQSTIEKWTDIMAVFVLNDNVLGVKNDGSIVIVDASGESIPGVDICNLLN